MQAQNDATITILSADTLEATTMAVTTTNGIARYGVSAGGDKYPEPMKVKKSTQRTQRLDNFEGMKIHTKGDPNVSWALGTCAEMQTLPTQGCAHQQIVTTSYNMISGLPLGMCGHCQRLSARIKEKNTGMMIMDEGKRLQDAQKLANLAELEEQKKLERERREKSDRLRVLNSEMPFRMSGDDSRQSRVAEKKKQEALNTAKRLEMLQTQLPFTYQ